MRLPRCRAVMKWTGTGLCAALTSAWFLSGWWSMHWCLVQRRHDSWTATWLGVAEGNVWIDRQFDPNWNLSPPGGVRVERISGSPRWKLRVAYQNLDPTGKAIAMNAPFSSSGVMPLWAPLVVCGLATLALWRRPRTRDGHCACAYNLSGLPAGSRCPECGKGAVDAPSGPRP